ncbi:unnamed protein product [Lactuca saligna]|uniref:Uncharacterized protein n=1 Tax=Lactuca saligna TaxID=75948 RepID=A0AA35YTP9_LACSI|nr:unnamed protein product [Lactuca saligna]
MFNSLSLRFDLDDLLGALGYLVLEILAISTMINFVCLVFLASTCGCFCGPLSGCTFFGEMFVIVHKDFLRNGGVVLGDVVAFGVNIGIRLIRLKGESHFRRETICLSCMVISNYINDATQLPGLAIHALEILFGGAT